MQVAEKYRESLADIKGFQQVADEYQLQERPEFQKLAELSERTEFEGIEVHGSSAVKQKDLWWIPATVYVTLNYGSGHDGVRWSDAYAARVILREGDKGRYVERIEVDTSSFFES